VVCSLFVKSVRADNFTPQTTRICAFNVEAAVICPLAAPRAIQPIDGFPAYPSREFVLHISQYRLTVWATHRRTPSSSARVIW
jgi:hypothetical protein